MEFVKVVESRGLVHVLNKLKRMKYNVHGSKNQNNCKG